MIDNLLRFNQNQMMETIIFHWSDWWKKTFDAIKILNSSLSKVKKSKWFLVFINQKNKTSFKDFASRIFDSGNEGVKLRGPWNGTDPGEPLLTNFWSMTQPDFWETHPEWFSNQIIHKTRKLKSKNYNEMTRNRSEDG